MFDEPTVVNYGDKLRGFGDGNGKEIAYGHENLMDDIRQATKENSANDELLMKVIDKMDRILNAMNRPIVLDNGALVGYMLDDIDAGLGDVASLKLRGVK